MVAADHIHYGKNYGVIWATDFNHDVMPFKVIFGPQNEK